MKLYLSPLSPLTILTIQLCKENIKESFGELSEEGVHQRLYITQSPASLYNTIIERLCLEQA